MESPEAGGNTGGGSLPFISSPEENNEGPSLTSSTHTSAHQTRGNSGSKFVHLPTLHPELEGYTPGEFSIRISQHICRGLSSQQSKLKNTNTESKVVHRQDSVQRSIQQFEDILRKRDELTSARQRQISSKNGDFGNSMHLPIAAEENDKQRIKLRMLKRADTMRNLVSSNLSINKTALTSSRKRNKKDRILAMEPETLSKPLALNNTKAINSGTKKTSSQMQPGSVERDGSGIRTRRRSLRQNSEIAYKLRSKYHFNRRQSMVPLEDLRRKTNSQCRFHEYGEAKFFFIKRVKMVTLLRKWWSEFSSKYQSVEYKMKTFLDLANDIEEVSLNRTQSRQNAGLKFDPKYFKASRDIGISREVMLILCMRPHQRTKQQIQKVVNGLQSLQAYAEYPIYMQEQLAKVAYYQEITPKRVIVRQGHTPENFYFILSGTASVKVIVRNENSVAVNVVATLKRGQSFGEIALLHNSCRTATVESVSSMKLLSIWRDDFLEIFFNLKSDIEPEHISFCRDIPFLKNWPINEVMKDPSNCFSHYFRRGAVVVPDSRVNDWIYIVKTGSCRVLKRLKAVEPYKTWDGKRPINTDILQSFGANEKESKTNSGFSKSRTLAVMSPIEKAMTEFFLTKEPQTSTGDGQDSKPAEASDDTQVVEHPSEVDKNTQFTVPSCMTGYSKSSLNSFLSQCKVNRAPLPIITKYEGKQTEDYVKPTKPPQPCYITLKKLLPKDAFGLESVEFEDEQYDRPSVSLILVSDGSELVIISKKVFVKFANEFVRQYVREHVQYYPSEDILQENLQTEINWELYKEEVLNDTMEKLRVSVC